MLVLHAAKVLMAVAQAVPALLLLRLGLKVPSLPPAAEATAMCRQLLLTLPSVWYEYSMRLNLVQVKRLLVSLRCSWWGSPRLACLWMCPW